MAPDDRARGVGFPKMRIEASEGWPHSELRRGPRIDRHECRSRMVVKIIASCLLLILTPAIVWAEFSGEIVEILDGDTIEVLHNHQAERIRLTGIDGPEKGQPYGKRANKRRLSWSLGKRSP